MPQPTLTVESHVELEHEYRLTVRVPDTAADALAGIVGEAVADGPDTLHTTVWAKPGPPLGDDEPDEEISPAAQRAEVRLLIEGALAQADAAAAEPVAVARPGTEL